MDSNGTSMKTGLDGHGQEMPHYPVADIDLAAIAHNLDIIKEKAPHSRVMAMIKADAYSHGLIPVAKCLRKADGLGVDRLVEAVKLREAGIDKPRIFITQGVFDHQELKICIEKRLDISVHCWEHIKLLQEVRDCHLNVWLKLDVGLHRFGFSPRDFPHAYKTIRSLECVADLILYTHMSSADSPEPELMNRSKAEISLFQDVTKNCPEMKSMANSAAIIAYPEIHLDWIRPGCLLYGLTEVSTDPPLNLWPAMTLKSRLISIHEVLKGNRVGYRNGYVCTRDSRIGVVQMGFADGYPKRVAPGTPVLICGQKVPIIPGGISGQAMLVDVSELPPDVAVGDEVTFWGPGLRAEEVWTQAGVSPSTLICPLNGETVFRRYQNAQFYFSKVWNIQISIDDELLNGNHGSNSPTTAEERTAY